MALTKVNTTVLDIDSVSNALNLDSTATGIKIYATTALGTKAPINNAILTTSVTVPNISVGTNTQVAANAKFIWDSLIPNAYGPSSKGSGLRFYVSSSAPGGMTANDIWFNI